jgi:protoheme IX farnesyltransferase
MPRTAGRPLASGRLTPNRGLAFGVLVSLAGFALLATGPGLVSLALGLAGMVGYVGVYTLVLKPRLPESVVWGGPAGVFPLLIAWSASGRPWSLAPLYCCLVVVLWSPAHFWSLALARSEEYRAVGIPVLPLVRGERWTSLLILGQLVVLTVLPFWGVTIGLFHPWLIVAHLIAGVPLLWLALRLVRSPSSATAWWLFRLSGPYLAVIFLALVLARRT